ncbi:hypothetical protein JOB18_030249 [Solea senegalensis]|uniref:Uncharacterized protein n=1 Tax=Solea senegalensis TaxID=28829 RepID=A0AAV6Q7E7_SOLSE|nr:hypothetical protein JOB18_030249 [Solea senegalensis]
MGQIGKGLSFHYGHKNWSTSIVNWPVMTHPYPDNPLCGSFCGDPPVTGYAEVESRAAVFSIDVCTERNVQCVNVLLNVHFPSLFAWTCRRVERFSGSKLSHGDFSAQIALRLKKLLQQSSHLGTGPGLRSMPHALLTLSVLPSAQPIKPLVPLKPYLLPLTRVIGNENNTEGFPRRQRSVSAVGHMKLLICG